MSQDNNIMFINLPFVLISVIVNNITDNIDRVCFSLVCKRWFDNRNKYLLFNVNNTLKIPTSSPSPINNDQQSHNTTNTVGSYQSVYSTSLEFKEIVSMMILDNDTKIINDFYDLTLDQKTFSQYGILTTVREIFISAKVDLPDDALLSSNIIKINGLKNFKMKLPPTTKFLHFSGSSIEDFTKDCFPSGLEELTIRSLLSNHLTKGMLPDGLKSIFFGLRKDQPIEPGVLPLSLRSLTLSRAKPNQLAKAGVLPPNLESLRFLGFPPTIINEHYLPQTLQTLQFVPSSWIPFMKSLPNLTTLILGFSNENALNLSDLPPTLTSLALSSRYHLKSALSPAIKYLSLYHSQINSVNLYDFKEMFPETIQYHLEELSVSSLPESVLPNLKIDKLTHSNFPYTTLNIDHLEVKIMKEGIEQRIIKGRLNLQTLPYGIKYLSISFEELFFNTVTIPTSVETLEIRDRTGTIKKLPFYVIPNFVRTLIINFSFQYPLYIPPTLTNIIFKYLGLSKDKCHIRKIDSNYYLLVGWLFKDNYQDKRVAKIIHKSNFNHYFRVSQLFLE
ncbi:hypothetical protein PPL_01315 [Heterostelium album PN500]|uniref:Uncharacterized protein n=1 Tax=Heterostelium pallidum (strain ATCC 26659 / Pp 5 / PN500) TaxID=670386 RepID=D3AYQ1_HETP5|nr:hypothetical protein PPL_01315 [Heterostelium album PN500]EFA86078.1 hypothetical protein PPL_01315 [Heterostelium album PN500]|eukprot:XP_020438184.1 hypothetical protein PPL_01315 [Heterostelium album PN500]